MLVFVFKKKKDWSVTKSDRVRKSELRLQKLAFSFIKHEYSIDIAARIVYEISMLPVHFVSGPSICSLNSCIPPYIAVFA